jgi:hypothetical protein
MREPFKNVSVDGQPDDMSESRKAKLCSEWLAYCKEIGWKNSAMPHLADLFWKHDGWKTFKGWPR